MVTIDGGPQPRQSVAQEMPPRRVSFRLVTTSGAGARPRAVSAAHKRVDRRGIGCEQQARDRR